MIKFFKLITIVSSLIILNFIMVLFSNIYLSSTSVYITEQKQFSYYNNNYVLILISIFLFFFSIFLYYQLFRKKLNKLLYIHISFPHRKLNIVLIFFCFSLLFSSYINIFLLSNTPPFFSDNYINRIGYLNETFLWFVLRPFGAILLIVPILLGYLKAYYHNKSKSQTIIFVLFLVYILYLIFIGQKFSGILTGLFFFYLPQLIFMAKHGNKIITFKKSIIFIIFTIFIFLLLIYHYSNNPIALDIGGPVKFIFYRAFALQGHMSWGYYNYKDLMNFEPMNIFNGMHVMMETVGDPKIVESMFERNVNFTGGFPTIIIFSIPLGLNFIFLIFIYLIFIAFCHLLIYNVDKISYIFYAYILNYFITYFSRGSLFEIINIKVFGLIIMIIALNIITASINRKAKIESEL